jgi:hypothetical protein
MRLAHWVRVSSVLGILSVAAVLTGHLALTDIHHGEGDLALEWNVLRGCFGVIVAFQVAALVTLRKVSATFRN